MICKMILTNSRTILISSITFLLLFRSAPFSVQSLYLTRRAPEHLVRNAERHSLRKLQASTTCYLPGFETVPWEDH